MVLPRTRQRPADWDVPPNRHFDAFPLAESESEADRATDILTTDPSDVRALASSRVNVIAL